MVKKPDIVIETTSGPVRVVKDFYRGGWGLWVGMHMRFTDERFSTKKEAVEFLAKYAPEDAA